MATWHCPYTGPRNVDVVGAVLSVLGMGGHGGVLGILVWQEGGEAVAALLAIGAIAWGSIRLLAGATAPPAQADADRPGPVQVGHLAFGISEQMLQQIALGGTMIALPI